jgi:hypothetical protein
MADRVLDLLWKMTTTINLSEEILNQTLSNIVKILDFGSMSDREKRRIIWLKHTVSELKRNSGTSNCLTIPIIKLFILIGNLFPDSPDYSSVVVDQYDRRSVLVK